MTQPDSIHKIRAAARACGVAVSYRDYKKRLVWAEPEAMAGLIALLRGGFKDADSTLRQLKEERRGLPATLVAWDGILPPVWVWLDKKPVRICAVLKGEKGRVSRVIAPDRIYRRGEKWRVRFRWDAPQAYGYYTLRVGGEEAFLISAPRKLKKKGRKWGMFAPCHALPPEDGQGVGGYRELKMLASYVRGKGGDFAGTLPLLPVFYEGRHANPSPYSPVSRLFWNEIFLDVTDLPGGAGAKANEMQEPGDTDFVDYERVYAGKKKLLQRAAEQFFARYPEGDEGYRAFFAANPELPEYADFRAAAGEGSRAYHLFCQYACHIQFMRIRESGKCADIYLDYPLGVHPQGYDAQKYAELFLNGADAGAPPDMFFRRGQGWGFRPFDPRALERDRFAYFRATLRHFFRYARMMRLDHIMGLYRLYCMPRGKKPEEGGYIYYPFNALLAVLCLEASMHGAILIGENLGTVPDIVNENMRAHGIHRMWIAQFEATEDLESAFETIEPGMLAGFNTHDMFPFKSFLEGTDLAELEAHDFISAEEKKEVEARRKSILKEWAHKADALVPALEKIAASPAHFAMAGIDDILGETQPQNMPGTVSARNWSRRLNLKHYSQLDESAAVMSRHRGGAA